jgi:outer membrane receptor protein involved in Fe transport
MIEEVVVTATKREQSVQDVPIAISAFSGDDLAARGITDVYSLQQVSPSLFINTSNSTTNGGTMRIRGVGTTGNNVGLEAAVGFFIDGVHRSRSGQAMNDVLDVERIEVLRGPQGTLFGKNTSAGAVHIISNKPDYTENSGWASVSAGSLDTIRAEAGYNAVISDTSAVRIAANYHERDGYYEDIDNGDEYNELDRYAIKAQWAWDPSDTFSLRVIADYSERDESCCPATYSFHGATVPISEALGGNLVIDPEDGDVGVNSPPFEEVEDSGLTVELNWDLGWAELQSVTGMRSFEAERGQDVDFSNVDIYLQGNTEEEFDTWSQELRLVGGTDNLDWLVGFMYGEEEIENAGRFLEIASQGPQYFGLLFNALLGADPVAIASILEPGMGLRGEFEQDAEFWAVFTHNTYHFTDNFDVTLGLRYSEEDKDGATIINETGGTDTVAENWPCAALPVATFCQNAGYSLSRTDEETTGGLTFNYAFNDDVNVYATASRGFKSGGFNLDPTAYKIDSEGNVVADAREFDAELVDMYELGLKSTFLDGRLTINAAAFTGEIEDFQLNTFEGAFFTVNSVPEVEVEGIEVEYTYMITDGVMLTGGLTNINTRYGSSAGSDVGKPELDGKRTTNSPEWQGSAALFVDRPLTDGINWTLNLNYFHRGEHNTGSSLGPLKVQGAFNLWNAQVGLRSQSERWEAFLWANNLLDEDYQTIIFNSVSQAGSRSSFVGEPRIWGLTLKTRF